MLVTLPLAQFSASQALQGADDVTTLEPGQFSMRTQVDTVIYYYRGLEFPTSLNQLLVGHTNNLVLFLRSEFFVLAISKTVQINPCHPHLPEKHGQLITLKLLILTH